MSARVPITITSGTARGPQTVTHPNDRDLHLVVHHPAGSSVRLETDDSAYSGEPNGDGTSQLTVPASALMHRIGRMDTELQVNGRPCSITLDLLAPPGQAEQVRELVNELVRTPLALLAMPRIDRRLEPNGEGEPDRVQNLTESSRLLSEAAQLLASNPPTRVDEVEAEISPGTRLSAAILEAIIQQPYAMQPATPGLDTLPIRGRHYTALGVRASAPSEDTDTPANRFVHGVSLALERLAHETLADLAGEHQALADTTTPIAGYVTIRQLTITQAVEAARARVAAVQRVIREVRVTRARLEKRLPVRVPNRTLTTSPRLLIDPRYARVRRTLDLLRAPARDTYGVEGLVAGITNVTTLFELYCLATLHDLLVRQGWALTKHEHDPTSGPAHAPHLLLDGQAFPNTFSYSHEQLGEAAMLYEPRITRDAHPRANLVCVSANTSNLTPDIVLVTEKNVSQCTPQPPGPDPRIARDDRHQPPLQPGVREERRVDEARRLDVVRDGPRAATDQRLRLGTFEHVEPLRQLVRRRAAFTIEVDDQPGAHAVAEGRMRKRPLDPPGDPTIRGAPARRQRSAEVPADRLDARPHQEVHRFIQADVHRFPCGLPTFRDVGRTDDTEHLVRSLPRARVRVPAGVDRPRGIEAEGHQLDRVRPVDASELARHGVPDDAPAGEPPRPVLHRLRHRVGPRPEPDAVVLPHQGAHPELEAGVPAVDELEGPRAIGGAADEVGLDGDEPGRDAVDVDRALPAVALRELVPPPGEAVLVPEGPRLVDHEEAVHEADGVPARVSGVLEGDRHGRGHVMPPSRRPRGAPRRGSRRVPRR
jgi:hypothetical protein